MVINEILLLHHDPLVPNASTIIEHVNCFNRYSRFKVYTYNVLGGFLSFLKRYEFKIILLHYSLFGYTPYRLDDFYAYLDRCKHSYKIAFFQDEYYYCQPRFKFLNEFKIDCIYTLLRPENYKDVYLKYCKIPKIIYNLPGYVSEDVISRARQVTKPDSQREIDVGYRGRELPWYMGRGALEKTTIAAGFLKHAAGQGLKLDIETHESKRIYGGAWLEFIANCRAVLGVEAGVSIFDIEDTMRTQYERLTSLNPNITIEDLPDKFLDKWENNIYYRTISPRHFESAALYTCQILFEGDYSGIMKPMVHYIPLRKDFTNIDEVFLNFRNKELRRYLTENAYRDLIHSGRYSYENFVGKFDEDLIANGLMPHRRMVNSIVVKLDIKVSRTYNSIYNSIYNSMNSIYNSMNSIYNSMIMKLKGLPWLLWIKFCGLRKVFPGKRFLHPLVRPILRKLDRWMWGPSLGKELKQEEIPQKVLQKGVSNTEYWTSHNITSHHLFSSTKESLEYLDWRNGQYLFYEELMPCSGFDDCVILDYGCGPGHDIIGFIETSRPKHIIGMDISPSSLEEARHRIALHNTESVINLVLIQNGMEIPLTDNCIDYIHCSGVLHHLENMENTLLEFYRIMKSSGKIKVMVYNYFSLWVHLYVAFQKQISENIYSGLTLEEAFRRSTDGPDCPISRYYKTEEFIQICSGVGFKTKYLGSAISLNEMSLLPQRYSAILNQKLDKTHRDFLRYLSFDRYGRPLHNGQVAGIDSIYELRKE